MVGRVVHLRKAGKLRLREERLGGVRLLSAEFYEPEGCSLRRAERRLWQLEDALCRSGAGRVILPEDFPYKDRIRRLRAVEPLHLYRGAADVLALGWLRGKGTPPEKSRVLLAGNRLCPDLRAAAERLCPNVRELIIDVPEGGERYSRWLSRQWGMPELIGGWSADLTIRFAPGGEKREGELLLYGSRPWLDGLSLSHKAVSFPPEYAQSMLALLWEFGKVDREGLYVTFSGETIAKGRTLCYNN